MQFSNMALGLGRSLPTLRKGRLVFALTLPLIATGCSSVPDAINPAEWYRSTVDYVSGDEETAKDADAKPVEVTETAEAKGDEKFPPLPGDKERAQADHAKETQAVAQGLVADTQEGRYSSEAVARQGEAVSPLQPSTPAEASSAPAATVSQASAPAPMQQQVATRMAPVAKPVDTTGMSLQEIYQANLAQRRPYSASAAPSRPGGEAQPMATGGYYPTQTVVISGSGVVQGGQASPSRLQFASAAQGSRSMASVVSKNGAHDLSEFNPASVSNSFKVAVIQFSNGATNLTKNERAILRKVVALHKERGGSIRVVGHASSRTRDMDPVRHKMVNWSVSTSRANTIAKEFLRLGVSANNLYVGAMADNEPVYYEVMPSGEAGNRRAEIYIDY